MPYAFKKLPATEEKNVTVNIRKIVVVDGVEVAISAEGGSAKEALAIVDAAAEELGAAPPADDGAKGAGRKRRTKAEMDAARAALAAGEQLPLPLDAPLPSPAAPARVFTPPAPAPGETVVWSDAPALPPETRSVGFEAPAFEPPPPSFDPPPPAKSEAQMLCEQIDAAIKQTVALNPAWENAILDAYHAAARPFGGDILAMSAENLRAVLDGVMIYQRKVAEAVARK